VQPRMQGCRPTCRLDTCCCFKPCSSRGRSVSAPQRDR
jgi:hypothetical protein